MQSMGWVGMLSLYLMGPVVDPGFFQGFATTLLHYSSNWSGRQLILLSINDAYAASMVCGGHTICSKVSPEYLGRL